MGGFEEVVEARLWPLPAASIAVPNDMPYESVREPCWKDDRHILSRVACYLVANGVTAEIVTMEGAVEVAPRKRILRMRSAILSQQATR